MHPAEPHCPYVHIVSPWYKSPYSLTPRLLACERTLCQCVCVNKLKDNESWERNVIRNFRIILFPSRTIGNGIRNDPSTAGQFTRERHATHSERCRYLITSPAAPGGMAKLLPTCCASDLKTGQPGWSTHSIF
jgi:hypothetical protein